MADFNVSFQTKEDKLFFSRIDEAIVFSEKTGRTKFIGFLDERESYLSERYLSHRKNISFRMFGGFRSARRNILAISGTYVDDCDFPLCAVRFTYRKEDKLTHRDFLGSLMGANFKRDAIGDILIYEGYAIVFVLETILSPILTEVKKIGRVGVSAEQISLSAISYEQKFEVLNGTVSSQRLDCIVALLTKKSREQATSLICDGNVFLNYVEINKASFSVNEKDIITIRGVGKFILHEIGGITKKGRVNLSFYRYI